MYSRVLRWMLITARVVWSTEILCSIKWENCIHTFTIYCWDPASS